MFIIVYEVGKGSLSRFKAIPEVYSTVYGADEAAKRVAVDYQARTYLVEFPDPPRLEVASKAIIDFASRRK